MGSVFQLTPPSALGGTWSESDIYTFAGGGSEYPSGSLALGPNGELYGTTTAGTPPSGGTVFQLTPPAAGGNAWTLSTLHVFRGGKTDGHYAFTGVVVGNGGSLFGTTQFGGAAGNGTIFKVTPPRPPATRWTESNVYSFTGGSNGAEAGALVSAGQVTLLGVTSAGGEMSCAPHQGGCGTVLELTSASGQWTQRVLHTFHGLDGAQPDSPLIPGPGGSFFGTTYLGGANAACAPVNASYPCGTVFQLQP